MIGYICDRCRKLMADYSPDNGELDFKIYRKQGLGIYEPALLCTDCEKDLKAFFGGEETTPKTQEQQIKSLGYVYTPESEIEVDTAKDEGEEK